MQADVDPQLHHDVVIIGAGLAGIAAAWHLKDKCPNRSFVLLEARSSIGGTWDYFRYPGVRSDSDMFTFGYSFRPWTGEQALADGDAILEYLRQTAHEEGITPHVQLSSRVTAARWDSTSQLWTLTVRDADTGDERQHTCSFVFSCSGYYDYSGGYSPEFAGLDDFEGQVVHPQLWDEEVDSEGKDVVIIGSGATAVTLVPSLSKRAERVVMVQRSPTYMLTMASKESLAPFLERILSPEQAARLLRLKNICISAGFYQFCRTFPKQARAVLRRGIREQVGDAVDVDKHFTPRYAPWDQQLCLIRDGDFFEALRTGAAELRTAHISRFEADGVILDTGEKLPADLVVTATGLKVQILSDVEFVVDGEPVRTRDLVLYRGTLLAGLPNMAMAFGHAVASWTLKCELACKYVCSLLNEMAEERIGAVVPDPAEEGRSIGTLQPFVTMRSGYIRRAEPTLPRQGSRGSWKFHQTYVQDAIALRFKRTLGRGLCKEPLVGNERTPSKRR